MPTASQIMAAKKQAKAAAKIARQAKQQIGTGRVQGDRNRRANIEYRQHCNRRDLREGRPCGRDSAVTDEIRSWLAYGELVYGHHTPAVTVFEKLIRAMRCVAGIYADYGLSAAANAAQHCLEQSREKADLSPNQRRVLLRPLRILINYAAAYAETVPERTVEGIAKYCASVQVALYATALFERPRAHYESLNAVIRDESLRDLAKHHRIKMPELRIGVLEAAWCLYRIAECFEDVDEPQSIPDLRRPEWRDFGNPEILQGRIRAIVEKWLIPFENHTGLTLIDFKQFRQRLIDIETKHHQAA